MRLGYFADGPWSHLALEKLIADEEFSLQFICARFDNPDPVLRKKAEEYGVPFLVHQNINSSEFLGEIHRFNCDIYVSMSFNQIFRSEIISKTPNGIINCHAGKLPFYRGRNVLNWALINGEKEFGVTVHYVDDGVDTGDIIVQETYEITQEDDYETLLTRSYGYCADNLYKALRKFLAGEVETVRQTDIHPTGFYCSQRKVGDEILEWNQTSTDIFNFVRSICKPGPQARTFLNGEEIMVNKVELIAEAPTYKGVPGAVLGVDSLGFVVKTADSFVRVVDWTSNAKIRIGDRFK